MSVVSRDYLMSKSAVWGGVFASVLLAFSATVSRAENPNQDPNARIRCEGNFHVLNGKRTYTSYCANLNKNNGNNNNNGNNSNGTTVNKTNPNNNINATNANGNNNNNGNAYNGIPGINGNTTSLNNSTTLGNYTANLNNTSSPNLTGNTAITEDDLTRMPVADRPHPDYDPIGIRWNSVYFYPSITEKTRYETNVFATDKNAKGDFSFVTSPNMLIRYDNPLASFQGDFGADFYNYSEFDSENRFDAHARMQIHNELSHDLVLDTTLEASRKHDERGDSALPPDAAHPIPYTDLRGETILTKTFNRFGVSLGGSVRNLTYEDVESFEGEKLDQSWRNGTILTGMVKPFYEFSPGYRLYAKAQVNNRDYEGTGDLNRDSHGYDVRGGLEFGLTSLLTGSVEVGHLDQTYKDKEIDPVSGLSAGGKLTWLVTPLMTISLTGDRVVSETTTPGVEARLDTSAGLQVDYELLRNLVISTGAKYKNENFEGTDREDNIFKLSTEIDYYLNRTFKLGARYDFIDRDSTESAFTYENHVVMFYVTAQH